MKVGPAAYPTTKVAKFFDMIDLCHSKQYSALELEFIGITANEYTSSKAMEDLAHYAQNKGISLSIHGSMYINLAAIEESKVYLTKDHIQQGFRAAQAASANLIFHPGYFQKLRHEIAIQKAISLLNDLELSDPSIVFLETPGKLNSIGSLSEILEIATQTGVQIGVDWSHYFARNFGKNLKEVGEILEVFTLLENTINQKYFHMHISGIEFSQKGEKRHLSFSNSDFPLELVVQSFQEIDYPGTLICESPRRWEGDTELIQQIILGNITQIPRKKPITLFDYFK